MIVIVDIDRSTSLRYGDGSKPYYYILLPYFGETDEHPPAIWRLGYPGFDQPYLCLTQLLHDFSWLQPSHAWNVGNRSWWSLRCQGCQVHRSIACHRATGFGHVENPIIEGSLEVKLPTIWTVEKQRWEESEEKESEERRCRCAKR